MEAASAPTSITEPTETVMKALIPLVALVAATLPFAPTTAQDTPAPRQIVHYGDLDLSRADGVRALDNRLRAAIERACGPASPADPVGTRAVHECRAELRAEVAEQRSQLLAGRVPDAPIVVALAR
jgi:UrcA family protein